MKRAARLALMMVMTLGRSATASPEESGSAIPAAFAPFEHFIGPWKGTGIPTANRIKGWSERHLWAWKFANGRPVALVLTIEGGKILAKGQLTYDAATKRYRLEGTDPAGAPVAFAGAFDTSGRALALDRVLPSNETGAKERLTLRPNSNMIRYTMWLDRQEPGAPQFSRAIEMNLGKEGEAFAAGGSATELPKCIVTGGAATLTVLYEGKSYPLCCSGCRDEFLESPAKYVKKALRRASGGSAPQAKATATGLRKDDGAFDGLVDDPPPSKPSAQPATPKPTTFTKTEPPKAEPSSPASKSTGENDSASKAASLLRSAQSLEKLGKTSAALDYYRQVVSKYPKTSQAKSAQERIKALEQEK